MDIKPRFKKGDNVLIISSKRIGTVNDVMNRDNNIAYKVTVDGKVSVFQEKYLELFVDEEQDILNSLYDNDYGCMEDFKLFQTWYRLKRPIEGNLYSYLGSKTIFNPYQFKPLLKFLSPGSEERLFIADEVGVGKTIEAGIVITELIARGVIDRKSPILIVCPNSIGPKWIKEMEKRFNLHFWLHNGDTINNALKMAKSGHIPENYTWSVASLQLLRNKKYLDMIESLAASRIQPLWELVIIDETHHMRNSDTESNILGNTLSSMTNMMLMLSATPLNLRDEDLFNQLHILNPSMFPDLQTFTAMISPTKSINRCRKLLVEDTTTVFGEILKQMDEIETGPLGSAISSHPGVIELKRRITEGIKLSAADIARFDRMLLSLNPLDNSFTRTLKREAIGHRVTREPVKIGVEFTSEEMDFYNDVIELSKEVFLLRGGNPTALGFITNMPRRMVASCIPAMKEYIKWCIDNNVMYVYDSEGEAEDDSEYNTIELPPEIKNRYMELYKTAEKLEVADSKYNEFLKLVKQLLGNLENPQIIVFSFFVRTLKYLFRRLVAEGYKVGLICGDVPLLGDGKHKGRYDIMEDFEQKELSILLSSEVGGEGLDFQFCQAIINYDLPYNPMRVEQRIGRIDRFGQNADKVIVGNLYIKNTVDENIYNALYVRIKIVEESIGAMEPILGDKLTDLQNEIISGNLSQEQIEQRVKEIELAVEQAKLEMERFENNRKELLGDDDFVNSISNLEDTDFVHPEDALRLTCICLSRWKGCNIEVIDNDKAKIALSKEVVAKLETYTRRPGSEGCFDELNPLITKRFPLSVIFNGSKAVTNNEYHFLQPCGFWTKFLIRELEFDGNPKKIFKVSMSSNNAALPEGIYLMPMFEVKLEGFRTELNLAAVPVIYPNLKVVECDYIKMSRGISRDLCDDVFEFDFSCIEDPESYTNIAREAIEDQMEDKLTSLKAENTYRVTARINSLTQGSKVRIEKLKRRIFEHTERMKIEGKEQSVEFIRLTEAMILAEQQRTKESIEKLNEKSNLSLTTSLISIGVLRIK